MKAIKLILAILFISLNLTAQTQLTVYNHGQALVKENFSRTIRAGVSELEIEDVAESLNPSSVKLSSDQGLMVLEQNYRYDLVDQNKLLKKYLGAEVTVVMQNDKKITGELLSYTQGALVIKGRTGTDILQRSFVGSIKCPTPKERLYVRPTLSWRVQSDQVGKKDLKLSYLTNNISWTAEYVAVLDDSDTEMDLSSWISLNNRSGKDYIEAKLKLVAGDLNRASSFDTEMDFTAVTRFSAKAARPVEERSFFEYHLYDIGFPVTVNNQEEKQIQWLNPTQIKTEKRYIYAGRSSQFENIPIKVMFTNDKKTGTGMALPAGIVRLFKADTDGALELIGEDNLKHTSKDDLVTFEVGKAYDVKGQYDVLDRRSKQDRYREEDVRITLANRKDEAVEIDVIQSVGYQNWEIVKASSDHTKLDASRVKFIVSVPANSEQILTYTTRISLK